MNQAALPHDHGTFWEKHMDSIPKTDEFQTPSDIFRLLGDSSRLRIFWILCHCEECVINISAMMGMSSPAVSHHLRALKNSGLIVSRRKTDRKPEGRKRSLLSGRRHKRNSSSASYERRAAENYLSRHLLNIFLNLKILCFIDFFQCAMIHFIHFITEQFNILFIMAGQKYQFSHTFLV